MTGWRIFLLGGSLFALALAVLIPRLSPPAGQDEVAMRLLNEGRAGDAAYVFTDPEWRGFAEIQAGRYRRAVAFLLVGATPDAAYNAGVALAKLHDLANAANAFRKALDLDPGHEDARYNLAVVERAAELDRRRQAEAQSAAEGEAGLDGPNPVEEDKEAKGGESARASREMRALSRPVEDAQAGGEGDGLTMEGESRAQPGAPTRLAGESDAEPSPEAGSAAAIRRESAMAAAILLRRIEDDPARVLAARMRAAEKRGRIAP